jgi:hypothetical protein
MSNLKIVSDGKPVDYTNPRAADLVRSTAQIRLIAHKKIDFEPFPVI